MRDDVLEIMASVLGLRAAALCLRVELGVHAALLLIALAGGGLLVRLVRLHRLRLLLVALRRRHGYARGVCAFGVLPGVLAKLMAHFIVSRTPSTDEMLTKWARSCGAIARLRSGGRHSGRGRAGRWSARTIMFLDPTAECFLVSAVWCVRSLTERSKHTDAVSAEFQDFLSILTCFK